MIFYMHFTYTGIYSISGVMSFTDASVASFSVNTISIRMTGKRNKIGAHIDVVTVVVVIFLKSFITRTREASIVILTK